MPDVEKQTDAIDWGLTTWEGSRREQLRRWAALSLKEIILAQEEMREVAERLAQAPVSLKDERGEPR
jgi:hypothetical protein